MKLGIYCRISRLKDGNDLSIEDQKLKGIAKANALNIPYEIYIDEGISGTIDNRPEFQRFLGDVSNSELSHVFAIDQARFEREPQIRFLITDLFRKKNIVYITQMDGVVDLHDPQSTFFGDLLSVFNKFHVTQTKIKVKSVLRNRVAAGKTRGISPYGYGKDENDLMVIDEDEAVTVRRIFELSLAGTGTKTIANILNSERIPTRYNKINKGTIKTKNKHTGFVTETKKKDIQWSPNTILNIIKNPIYKGERTYSGILTKVPAIFDSFYWDKVNFHIPLNRNNTGKKVEYRFLLKGLLRCGVCGRNMYGHKRLDKHDNHYMCSSKRIKGGNCGNRSINIDRIEYLIWQYLFFEDRLNERITKEFNYDESEVKRIENKINELNKGVESLKKERKRAIDLVIKNIIREEDIAGNLKDIDTKIEEKLVIINENQTKLFVLENSKKIIGKYEKDFKEFTKITTFEQKQRIINDFIKNIIVLYDAELKEYKLDIEFKIDIPSTNIDTSLTKDDTSYYIIESEKEVVIGNETFVEGNAKVRFIPENYDNDLYDDGTKTDNDGDASGENNSNENENLSATNDNKKSFISPIINKIKDFHNNGIVFSYPDIQHSDECSFGWRRKLPTAWRNFDGTQWGFVFR